MPNGVTSERFPKDLKGLFSLDGKSNWCLNPIHLLINNTLLNLIADTVKALMVDYKLENPSNNNKGQNLNRFMQFCGVRYQLVE